MRLGCYIPEKSPESVSGSFLIDSLQNNSKPRIDLLIREAIQNSSDASLPISSQKAFSVRFTTGTFESSNLNELLDPLTNTLNKRYGDKDIHEYILIDDRGTTGLTGPEKISDINGAGEIGNFCKLVFSVGENQTEKTSGGSHGLGKGMYFQIGIGIVLFYTRIAIAGSKKYESRLIIALAEDEKLDSSLLRTVDNSSIGRAWWGRKSSKNDNSKGKTKSVGEIAPITDEKDINEILDIFNIKPHRGNATGTKIIIPYVDTDQLLQEAKNSQSFEGADLTRDWLTDLDSYISYCVQKWYFPRLNNDALSEFKSYKVKPIYAYVGATKIGSDAHQIYPHYKVAQDLYTACLAKLEGCEFKPTKLGKHDIVTKTVHNGDAIIRKGTGQVRTGVVSFARIPMSKMDDLGLGSWTPNALFGLASSSEPRSLPLVLFSREPGMILDYILDGDWTKGVRTKDDEILLGFFLPDWRTPINSKQWQKIKPNTQKSDVSNLGEYLRFGEKADHTHWEDVRGTNITANIRKRVANEIAKSLSPLEQTRQGMTTRLSTQLGRILFPPVEQSKNTQKRKRGKSRRKASTPEITINEISRLNSRDILIDCYLEIPKDKTVQLSSTINLDGGAKYTPKQWESNIDANYPIRFDEAMLAEIVQDGKKEESVSVKMSPENSEYAHKSAYVAFTEKVIAIEAFDDIGISATIHVVTDAVIPPAFNLQLTEI